jgi:DNA-directed RNA polymerase subunit RPC12/RpoP
MTDKKICIDCGKQFDPKIQLDEGINDVAIVVCEDCLLLLKRRFWNSMKMEMNRNNSIITQE